MFFRIGLCGAIAISLMLSGCHKQAASEQGQVETGIASWYGHPFDGRPTASGEIYDMEKLTAAHRTLPLGTVVRVHDLVNNLTVQVRINDRGPFVKDRIIDLSHAAATAISMPGIANVSLQIISSPPTRGVEDFAVQVGAFPDRASGERLRQQLEAKYGTARLIFRPGDETWRVLVGLQPTIESANSLAQQLASQYGASFVVLADSEQ